MRFVALAVALLLVAPWARADEDAHWKVGTRIEPFVLQDAHGEDVRVDDHFELILFAADMDAGDLVNQALQDPALQDLGARHAVFVSDISRMPGFVTTLFALPSMRRRPYRMVLDRGPGPTVAIPREEGRVTGVRLSGGVVTSIETLGSADQVAATLRATPTTGEVGTRDGSARRTGRERSSRPFASSLVRDLDRPQVLHQQLDAPAGHLLAGRSLRDGLGQAAAPDRHLARAVGAHLEAAVDEARDVRGRELASPARGNARQVRRTRAQRRSDRAVAGAVGPVARGAVALELPRSLLDEEPLGRVVPRARAGIRIARRRRRGEEQEAEQEYALHAREVASPCRCRHRRRHRVRRGSGTLGPGRGRVGRFARPGGGGSPGDVAP
jgi:hypothetical protein